MYLKRRYLVCRCQSPDTPQKRIRTLFIILDSILTKSFSLDSLQNLQGALYRHIDITLASDANCEKASSGLKERMIPAFDWSKDELKIPNGIDPTICGAYTYMEYSYNLPIETTPIALIQSYDSTRNQSYGHTIAEDDDLGGSVQGNVNGKFTYILQTAQMGYYDKNSGTKKTI